MHFYKVSLEQFEKDLENAKKKNANYPFIFYHDTKTMWENIKLPKRSTAKSAGYDFFSPFVFSLRPGETVLIPTGIGVHLDDDKHLAIVPRSGLGFKYRTQLDNTFGVIDADYELSDNEGHIMIKLTNDSKLKKMKLIDRIKRKLNLLYEDPNNEKTAKVMIGNGIAQGIIYQYFKTNDDDATAIRNGGFGSTTKE